MASPNSNLQALGPLNANNSSRAKQTPDWCQGCHTTPLKSHHANSDPRANGSTLMMMVRSQNQGGLAAGPFTPPNMLSSPRFKSTPASSWLKFKNLTPNNMNKKQQPKSGYNPFETGILDSLSKHVFSPNVFRVLTPDKQGTPKFQWSIDDIAILKPTEIDETPSLQFAEHNPELEEVAQRAIDEYFASQVIAPSPWSGGVGRPRPPDDDAGSEVCQVTFQSPFPRGGGGGGENCLLVGRSQTTETQTDFSIPPDVDFDSIVGNQFRLIKAGPKEENSVTSSSSAGRRIFPRSKDDQESEGVNNLSLRRKLFFQHQRLQHTCPFGDKEEDVREVDEEEEEEDAKDDNDNDDDDEDEFEIDTEVVGGLLNCPGVDHFSSSPIHSRFETPRLMRSSTEAYHHHPPHHQLPGSPEMSPISGPCRGRSSDLRTPVKSFDVGPITPIMQRPEGGAEGRTGSNLLMYGFTRHRFVKHPSDETGIEECRRSTVFHETLTMDTDSLPAWDAHCVTHHRTQADTGYSSNHNLFGLSNLTCPFSDKVVVSSSVAALPQDMSGLDDEVDARLASALVNTHHYHPYPPFYRRIVSIPIDHQNAQPRPPKERAREVRLDSTLVYSVMGRIRRIDLHPRKEEVWTVIEHTMSGMAT